MRDLDLVPVQPRPFRTTTEPDPHAPDSLDLVRRDFAAERPGIKVVGDITYIRTWQGWLYLASLIDCCTREVIGYAMADHLRTELVLGAVDMAIRNRRLDADCIMHSDRGTQYTSSESLLGRCVATVFGVTTERIGGWMQPVWYVSMSSWIPLSARCSRPWRGRIGGRRRGCMCGG